MIKQMDDKLQNKNGVFDEDLHERQRAIIMKRAEEAKESISGRSTLSAKRGGKTGGFESTVSAAARGATKQSTTINSDIDKIQKKYLNSKGAAMINNGLESQPSYELIEQSKLHLFSLCTSNLLLRGSG